MQKKRRLVWFKKLQEVWQITHLKQRFLSFTFRKTKRSYEKIMCIYFTGSVVKIVSYLHLLYTKDGRLQQIEKKHK